MLHHNVAYHLKIITPCNRNLRAFRALNQHKTVGRDSIFRFAGCDFELMSMMLRLDKQQIGFLSARNHNLLV